MRRHAACVKWVLKQSAKMPCKKEITLRGRAGAGARNSRPSSPHLDIEQPVVTQYHRWSVHCFHFTFKLPAASLLSQSGCTAEKYVHNFLQERRLCSQFRNIQNAVAASASPAKDTQPRWSVANTYGVAPINTSSRRQQQITCQIRSANNLLTKATVDFPGTNE